jgi:calcium-dependent protein kinase
MQSYKQANDYLESLVFTRASLVLFSNSKVSDKYEIQEKDILREEGSYEISSVYNKFLHQKILRSKITLLKLDNPKYFDIVRRTDHPYIIKSFEFFPQDGPSWIGDFRYTTLEHYLNDVQSISEANGAKLIRKILLALNYMHIKQFCHRSLSLKNIAFSPTPYIFAYLKLFNFTSAMEFEEGKSLPDIDQITVYTSPEAIKGYSNEKCDVWAAGILLYRALSKEFPYYAKNQDELVKGIAYGKLNFDSDNWKNISNDAQLFIGRLTHSAREALNDPWLLKFTRKRLDLVDEEVFKRMIQFKPRTKFQQLCFYFIADQLIPEEDTHVFTDLFDMLDQDHNGLLTKDDLIVQIDQSSIKSVMFYMNLARNDAISYSEFLMGAIEKNKILNDDTLDEGFKLIDQNHDGLIDKQDVMSYFKVTEEEAHYLIEFSLPSKSVESLNFDNFKAMMKEKFFS